MRRFRLEFSDHLVEELEKLAKESNNRETEFIRQITEIRNAFVHSATEIRKISLDETVDSTIIVVDNYNMFAISKAQLPPPAAERLLYYLLPRARREEIMGDLEEDYRTNFLPKFGPREARCMYWSHAIRSVAPVVLRSSLWAALAGWLWRKLGS